MRRKAPLKAQGGQPARSRLNQQSKARSDQKLKDAAWSAIVWARDRGECQAGPHGPAAKRVPEVACRGRRDPHHIFPKGKYPELRHDPDNGVTLCRAHHDFCHFGNPDKARELGLKGTEEADDDNER